MVERHFTGQGQVSASLTMLAYLAAETRRMRLGTAVVVLPWHSPVLITERAATLGLLSGGRLDFGVGKGYRAAEFAGFCMPPEEARERFDEAIEVIRRAWTRRRRFSHHVKRWHFEDVLVEPAPVQQPHPPLWMAAGSDESIRRAERDGFCLLLDQLASVVQVIERVSMFCAECARVGRVYRPGMVARALQIVQTEAEREAAFEKGGECLASSMTCGVARRRRASSRTVRRCSVPPEEITARRRRRVGWRRCC